MGKNKKITYVSIFFFITLLYLTIYHTSNNGRWSILRLNENFSTYESLYDMESQSIYPVFELQAIPLIKAGVGKIYRNDFIGTVVIAVDRDKVQDEIIGWSSLINGNYKVYLNHRGKLSDFVFGATLLSMASGLDYNERSFSNTLSLLKKINRNNRLITSNLEKAPVAIVFDYEVTPLILSGRNIEIIVPYEGTLYFNAGLINYSDDYLPPISTEDLLSKGFRLTNGTGDPILYGDSSKYESSKKGIITNNNAIQIASSAASFRRVVLGERLFSTASGIEHILSYIVYLILLVVWSSLIYMRISDKDLKSKLFAVSSLLLFWILVRVVKLILPEGFFHRLSWYLYYVPLSFMPSILFWIGQILIRKDKDSLNNLIRRISFIISAALAILVLTNDYHQQVFKFYMGLEGNNYDLYYSYGLIYYFIFARSLYLVIAFVLMASRNSTSVLKETLPLYTILIISILYFGGYALGLQVFRESDFTITYGIMGLLFMEICMRSRMIPNNIKLRELLKTAPINMSILSDTLKVDFMTDIATDIPGELISTLKQYDLEDNMPSKINQVYGDHTLYSVTKISGGFSVFTQNLDSIRRLRSKIEEQNVKIESQNLILSKTHKLKGEISSIKAKQELYSKIDSVIGGKIKEIEAIYAHLDLDDTEVFQNQLSRIKLLVNYCKRRGNLAILESRNDDCNPRELALWIRESLWEVNSHGIEGLLTESISGDFKSSTAAIIYDISTDILQMIMKYSKVTIMVNINEIEDHYLLRFLIEAEEVMDLSELILKTPSILSDFETSYTRLDDDEKTLIEVKIAKGDLK